MSKIGWRLYCAPIVLAAGLMLLWTVPAPAQTTEPPAPVTDPQPPEQEEVDEAGTPSTANPPAYIGQLMTETGLLQSQVDQMRTDGMGWGEIRIASRLAQQMSANSDGSLSFNDALAQVLAARAEGKGYGEIAAANNLKVGNLLNADKKGGTEATAAAKEKKPGLFARIGRALGFGKSADKPVKDRVAASDVKNNRPEHPGRPERPARVERMERPTTVEKPSKPEKPERGPSK